MRVIRNYGIQLLPSRCLLSSCKEMKKKLKKREAGSGRITVLKASPGKKLPRPHLSQQAGHDGGTGL
jgi:hypothetical protein